MGEEIKRRIAIIGTAESMAQAPFDDRSYEIWGLGVCLTHPPFKRYDRLYELHDKAYWIQPDVMERLRRVTTDLWMQDHYEELPQSLKYPLEEIARGFHRNFTSSIAYMIAHAAHEQRTLHNIGQVALWGVHMMGDEEYGHQRAACEYWLGALEALGVEVHVAGAGAILKCNYNYGYDKEWKFVSELTQRKQMLENGLKDLERQLAEARKNFHQQEGAILDVDWAIRRIQ